MLLKIQMGINRQNMLSVVTSLSKELKSPPPSKTTCQTCNLEVKSGFICCGSPKSDVVVYVVVGC